MRVSINIWEGVVTSLKSINYEMFLTKPGSFAALSMVYNRTDIFLP